MFVINRVRKFMAPDDGGSAGGESGGDSGASGGDNGDSGASDGGDAPQMPSGVPEKFWDAKSGEVNFDKWGKSTSELQGKLRSIKADTEKATRESIEAERFANRPEDISGYEVRVPDTIEMPEGFEFEFNEEDPMLNFWKEHVFNSGGDQEMFDNGIAAYISAKFGDMPDFDSEMEQLGEQGQYRAERVDLWAKANMSEEGYTALEEFATTANGIAALEELMEKAGEPAFSPTTTSSGEGIKSVGELRAMMNDPRYQPGPQHDPAYVREIERGFQKLVD